MFVNKDIFAQPLTSTPAGCAITVASQYRIYQIVTTSYNNSPTYTGTGGVRYTTWTDGSTGVDKTRLTCITLNTASATCYVKTGTGTTSTDYTAGSTTTFTVNSGSTYDESGSGTCSNVPIDEYAWIAVCLTGSIGFLFFKTKGRKYMNLNAGNFSYAEKATRDSVM